MSDNRGDNRNQGPRATRIYIAAPFSSKARAAIVADAIRKMQAPAPGYEVTADWIRSTATEESTDPADRATILMANRKQLAMADIGVLLTQEGRPGAHLIEAGEMLRLERPIVWSVEGGGTNVYDAANEMVVVQRDDEIPSALLTHVRKLIAWRQRGWRSAEKFHKIEKEYNQ